MGKPTGFMEYRREVSKAQDPKKRIKHFNEFHEHLPKEQQQQIMFMTMIKIQHVMHAAL